MYLWSQIIISFKYTHSNELYLPIHLLSCLSPLLVKMQNLQRNWKPMVSSSLDLLWTICKFCVLALEVHLVYVYEIYSRQIRAY